MLVHDERSCELIISESEGFEKTDTARKVQTASLTPIEILSMSVIKCHHLRLPPQDNLNVAM